MTNTENDDFAPYTPGQSVTVDAYDGPLAGNYIGTGITHYAFDADVIHYRIRIEEDAQGYEEGEVISALPVRVAPLFVAKPVADGSTEWGVFATRTAELITNGWDRESAEIIANERNAQALAL